MTLYIYIYIIYYFYKEGINSKMLFIRFEDLTSNPKTEVEKIYHYLGLPYYENHNFNNIEQITTEDDSVYGIYGDHTIKQKIEPQRKDYNEILGTEASNWIKNRYKWLFDEFGYF